MDNPIGCVQHDCDECKRTADTIESQQAEIARVRKDCDNKAACLKYICAEWNEDCESTCDSFCHAENCRSSNIGEAKKAMRLTIESQAARIEELEADCERERMRLAACGVVALANTHQTAIKAREINDKYCSASLNDVIRAVDRNKVARRQRKTSRPNHRARICAVALCD